MHIYMQELIETQELMHTPKKKKFTDSSTNCIIFLYNFMCDSFFFFNFK